MRSIFVVLVFFFIALVCLASQDEDEKALRRAKMREQTMKKNSERVSKDASKGKVATQEEQHCTAELASCDTALRKATTEFFRAVASRARQEEQGSVVGFDFSLDETAVVRGALSAPEEQNLATALSVATQAVIRAEERRRHEPQTPSSQPCAAQTVYPSVVFVSTVAFAAFLHARHVSMLWAFALPVTVAVYNSAANECADRSTAIALQREAAIQMGAPEHCTKHASQRSKLKVLTGKVLGTERASECDRYYEKLAGMHPNALDCFVHVLRAPFAGAASSMISYIVEEHGLFALAVLLAFALLAMLLVLRRAQQPPVFIVQSQPAATPSTVPRIETPE
jgi:hypothetical protein